MLCRVEWRQDWAGREHAKESTSNEAPHEKRPSALGRDREIGRKDGRTPWKVVAITTRSN